MTSRRRNNELAISTASNYILNSPKREKAYKPQKLTELQKTFGTYKPVKDFYRFPKGIPSCGIDPSKAFSQFTERDMIHPLSRPKLKEAKYYPDNPLRWSVGCTKHCNNEKLEPKIDEYKDYFYYKRNQEDVDRYEKFFIPTDNIAIRVPEISKSYDQTSSFLNKKSKFGMSGESHSDWIPKTYQGVSVGNKPSVDYDIINFKSNPHPIFTESAMLNKTLNNKKKGVTEFSNFTNPYYPNYSKHYKEVLDNDNKAFYHYNGVFSELYDSANRNGNIYIPFRPDEEKLKEIRNRRYKGAKME